MTPDMTLLRHVPDILTAELLQMERDRNGMKGRDNRAAHDRLIAIKRAALEFHQWALSEVLK